MRERGFHPSFYRSIASWPEDYIEIFLSIPLKCTLQYDKERFPNFQSVNLKLEKS